MASESHLYQLDPPSMPYFGADPCWGRDREGQKPAACKKCGGYDQPRSADPLADTTDPKSGRTLVWVCMACLRTHRINLPGRVCEPNAEVLSAYGDLQKRDSEDRTAAAVKLSKRGRTGARKAS